MYSYPANLLKKVGFKKKKMLVWRTRCKRIRVSSVVPHHL